MADEDKQAAEVVSRTGSREMEAISKVLDAMDPLPADARRRIVEYVTDFYGLDIRP